MKGEPLTDYEAKVVERIAVWKGRRPGPMSRAMEVLKWPLDRGLKSVIPGNEAARLLAKLNETAEWKRGYDLIRRDAEVDNLVQLRKGSLERCDQLERRVELAFAGVVTSGSLLAGVGGIATELGTIPAKVLLALKAVHRVAGCYGYPLHGPGDQTTILAVIGLAMINKAEDRVNWCEKIQSLADGEGTDQDSHRVGEVIDDDVRAKVVDDAVKDLETSVLEHVLAESVPFLGSAIGVVLDNQFIREIESTTRCVFQERWLRDNGKVAAIAPVEGHEGILASLNQAAYATGYVAGFGVAVPVALTSKAGAYALPQPALDGLKDGAESAARQVDLLIPKPIRDLDAANKRNGKPTAGVDCAAPDHPVQIRHLELRKLHAPPTRPERVRAGRLRATRDQVSATRGQPSRRQSRLLA